MTPREQVELAIANYTNLPTAAAVNEREVPVDAQGHVEHRDDGGRRHDEGDDSVDDDVLNGGRVVLNAIQGVTCSARVVVGERQALNLPKQL